MDVSAEDINILLLGENGVGKSTFINSLANYLEYEEFEVAIEEKIHCLIPAKFKVTNENFEEKIVQIGDENTTITYSAQTRSYLFPVAKHGINRIRLINTPSLGGTKDIDQDKDNLENILSYISHLENLHAICFLLKPNNNRLTVMFNYYIKQLLSRLEINASNNIIFLFTNTRGTFYRPGITTAPLKAILADIRKRPPYADINFTKDNVFCLDNECFRYLVAANNDIQLDNKQNFINSWNHSVAECWRMFYFISGQTKSPIKVTPHKVKDSMTVNEARRSMFHLSQALADIIEHINENMRALRQHNQNMQKYSLSIKKLNKNLPEVRNVGTEGHSMKTKIQIREGAVKETQRLIAKLEARGIDYEKEKDSIIETMAKFVHFFKTNAVVSYNDSYKPYIEYLIDRQKSFGDDCDFVEVKYMNHLLLRCEQEEKLLDQALTTNMNSSVTATEIFDSMKALYNLPLTGKKIKQMQTHSTRIQANELRTTEVISGEINQRECAHHPSCIEKTPNGKIYCCRDIIQIQQVLEKKDQTINELKKQIGELNKVQDDKNRLIENLTKENRNMRKEMEEQFKMKRKQNADMNLNERKNSIKECSDERQAVDETKLAAKCFNNNTEKSNMEASQDECSYNGLVEYVRTMEFNIQNELQIIRNAVEMESRTDHRIDNNIINHEYNNGVVVNSNDINRMRSENFMNGSCRNEKSSAKELSGNILSDSNVSNNEDYKEYMRQNNLENLLLF